MKSESFRYQQINCQEKLDIYYFITKNYFIRWYLKSLLF